MKKWLIMLALSLAITGCGDKGEQKQTKKQADKPKTLAIKKMDTNKVDLVMFLNKAEHAFDDIYYAAATMPNGKTLKEDGLIYRELPQKYNSKEKVVHYFSTYWSRPLAVAMYDNLNTKQKDGKVYVATGDKDYPVLISTRNTTVKADAAGVTAVVRDVTTPSFGDDRTITYRLVRDKQTKLYEISKRTGPYGIDMFD